MKALIVYESLFGNTELVAQAIADGLRDTFEVTVTDVATMPRAFGMDLLVVGGPTHAFGLSRPSTRDRATQQGTVRAGATDVGLREYLDCSPTLDGTAAAAFDTKINKTYIPGSAAHRAQRQLRRLGCHIVTPAESFYVTGTIGPLVADEDRRARRWGAHLATSVVAARHQV